jgi:hypothetical protein
MLLWSVFFVIISKMPFRLVVSFMVGWAEDRNKEISGFGNFWVNSKEKLSHYKGIKS